MSARETPAPGNNRSIGGGHGSGSINSTSGAFSRADGVGGTPGDFHPGKSTKTYGRQHSPNETSFQEVKRFFDRGA
jgi:hypothetical protein